MIGYYKHILKNKKIHIAIHVSYSVSVLSPLVYIYHSCNKMHLRKIEKRTYIHIEIACEQIKKAETLEIYFILLLKNISDISHINFFSKMVKI